MKENTTTANVIDDNNYIEDILDLDTALAMPTVIWNPETTTLRFQNCDSFAQIKGAIGMQFLAQKVDEKPSMQILQKGQY